MTSLDVALWLSCVSRTLGLIDEPDEDGVKAADHWLVSPTDAAAVHVRGNELLAATGMRSHRQLRRPFERLGESVVTLSLREGGRHRLWHGWEATPVDRSTPTEVGIVSGAALQRCLLEDEPWPIEVDLRGMAAFGSRHSAIMYLRALSWLSGVGTPKAWGRTPPGDRVSLTIPMADLHRGLGTGALRGMGAWNEKAFGPGGRGGPVHRDLASVGIRLTTTWEMAGTGARRVPIALGITVARAPAGARRVRRQDVKSSSSASSASSAP